jgi:hypothetical protein
VDVGVGAAIAATVGETFAVAAIDVVVDLGSEVVHCAINKTAISNAAVTSIRSNRDLFFIIKGESGISNVRLFSFRWLELCIMRSRITFSISN